MQNDTMLYSPDAFEKQEPKCKECQDTGIVFLGFDQNGYAIGKRCDCMSTRNKEKRYKNSGIPPAFGKKNFNNFIADSEILHKLKTTAIEYAENFEPNGPSLYMCGSSGVGKTHLSIAICNALIEKGVNVYYMIYREAINRLKQLFYKDEYAAELEPYKKVELLYIDDLFKGSVTDQEKNIMYEIVNYRYNNQLPMIISTELAVGGIRALDSAIAGRIEEMTRTSDSQYMLIFGNLKDRRRS